ncbi:dihydrofolate reductase family protein [Enterococcus pseudoavium]|uniref:Dihydrofolate reductase family protein n=1 Tax=Enterococcus pseudoavium TaxID=44007 RepID=A0ABU3FFK7_9ENTE|nr:dihydrofolate reductase family protein [Enterococcus pseudoavium]MDT2755230.1 dihydrofolate reductase family protein [Enterococcus pseudoavium]MDT2769820.1 dihydrofolate reductase family protein [Enterococcus pseudoavium]REC31972.1 dihydrofolate reductase [Enterococcus pseudoavium]
MARAVFYGAISLDGFLADKEDRLEWLYQQEGGELVPYEAFYQTIDYTMMGRRTYEVVKRDQELTVIYPEKENYVFSHSVLEVDSNLQVVNEDPVEFIKNLPADKTVWVVGGGALLQPVIEAGLIEEWWIQIVPLLLGEGIPLFLPQTNQQKFQLLETEQFGQFAQLHLKK